jgi:CheY-like chemotaxis protein
MTDTTSSTATPVQKVVVVNGNTDVLGMLESVLDAGRYDMVFVEPGERAYSQIRKVLPNLVILCTQIERLDGFQILTMLKLDPDTCDIPVLTYTMESEGQDYSAMVSPWPDEDDSTMFVNRTELRMN